MNKYNSNNARPKGILEIYSDAVDIQSVGAAIEHLLLAATELGLGSLWICDVFFGYEELCSWLGARGKMIVAVSLGYSDQSPRLHPRRSVEDLTTYVE